MSMDEHGLKRRCPRLGSTVDFGYCRQHAGGGELPCWKIFDCWWEIFDVVGHLKTVLTPRAFERLVEIRPRPKVTSLVEMIQRAQKALNTD